MGSGLVTRFHSANGLESQEAAATGVSRFRREDVGHVPDMIAEIVALGNSSDHIVASVEDERTVQPLLPSAPREFIDPIVGLAAEQAREFLLVLVKKMNG